MANPSALPLPLLVLGLGLAIFVLHKFATWADRDTRRRQRLSDIAARNAQRDSSIWEQSRMRDRAQPEAIDAMVIRHLKGEPHGKNG